MSPKPARSVLTRRGLRIAGIAGAAIAIAIVVFGIATRKRADAHLKEWTENQAVPVVAIATPDIRGKRTTIELPGRLEAYSQAQIYARVSGYIKEWKADIGAPVKTGQLLAEIDAPDLDQQIMQAQADVKAELNAQGIDPLANSPEQVTALIKADSARWSKVIKETGLKAE